MLFYVSFGSLCYLSFSHVHMFFCVFFNCNSATSSIRVCFSIGVASVVDLWIEYIEGDTLISNSD